MDSKKKRFHVRCKKCNVPVQPSYFWKHIREEHDIAGGVVPQLIEEYFGVVEVSNDYAFMEKIIRHSIRNLNKGKD